MTPSQFANDDNLGRATEVEGYKVLPPCVIYAKVGQGGMGAVYRGRHLNLDIDVAVKCLKPGLVADDDQFVVRFRREARAAARINHQNVIRVYDVAEDQGLHYLIMELVQGETARERVVRKQQLKVGEALEIVYEAALGLGEAHRKGFVHRDIKPDNLMISTSGQVKVADLGLAKPAVREDAATLLSGPNVVMGTPQYMPPEQWENTASVTSAADVWALGATLYYLLAGGEAIAKDSLPRIMQRIVMQPFPDIRKARPDVPDDVAALIEKATRREPGDRYQDGQELADAIQAMATRRDSLRDRDAAPTSQPNTLLSPPPAKTLARIKVWLDENAQRSVGDTVLSPSAARGGAGGSVGTQVMAPPPGGTVVQPPPVRRGNGLMVAGVLAALAIVAAVFAPWQRWFGERPFAAVERLAQQGRYAAALEAAVREYDVDPTLPGKDQRLAGLHAEWARQLIANGDLGAALVQAEQSLALRGDDAVRQQRDETLARIGTAVAAAFERSEPKAPLPANTARATLRGRLQHPLVAAVSVAGRNAAVAADGSFAIELDLEGRRELPTAAVLTGGQRLPLPGWRIDYAPGAGPAKPTEPDPARDPSQTSEPASTLPPVALTLDRERVELDDELPATVTIRTPKGAELEIDGQRVERSANEEAYVHSVRSADERPAPVVVTARLAGCRSVQKTIQVERLSRSLSFVRPPTFATGVVSLPGDRLATAEARLALRGQLSERGTTLLVDGQAVDTQWSDNGAFVAQIALPTIGRNELRIEAQKRFRAPAATVVAVTRLGEPALTVAGAGEAAQQTAKASVRVVATTDEWTTRVVARRDRTQVTLAAQATAPERYEGDLTLEVGDNLIVVEAVNCVGQKTVRELRVQRGGASARPVIEKVEIVVGDEAVAVEANRYAFLRQGGLLRVTASDPSAELWIGGAAAPGAEGLTVPLAAFVREGERVRLEVKLRNAQGYSQPFVFGATLDTTPPRIDDLSPKQAVPAGKDFICRGTWSDPNGLRRVTVGGRAAELTPVTGVAPSGSWQVRVTAPASGEIEVLVEDRAGNVTRAVLTVAP